MSHSHRFFMIFSGIFVLSFIFLLGITIFPIINGFRVLCSRLSAPDAPTKPEPPKKPDKPIEPRIGASKEEWDSYRSSLDDYKAKKREWKKDKEYFTTHKSEIFNEYETKRKRYSDASRKHVEVLKLQLVKHVVIIAMILLCISCTADVRSRLLLVGYWQIKQLKNNSIDHLRSILIYLDY